MSSLICAVPTSPSTEDNVILKPTKLLSAQAHTRRAHVTLTMWPFFSFSIFGRKALSVQKCAKTLTSKVLQVTGSGSDRN